MSSQLIVAITALLLLTGCKYEECHTVDDYVLRHQIFQKCLETVAAQPTNNGHIISECDAVARSQSHQYICKEKEGFGT